MGRRRRWRESDSREPARRQIIRSLAEGKARGLEGRELERFVSSAYPFGERRCYHYKVWLQTFALYVRGIHKPISKRRRKGLPRDLPGQRVLPGMEEAFD